MTTYVHTEGSLMFALNCSHKLQKVKHNFRRTSLGGLLKANWFRLACCEYG